MTTVVDVTPTENLLAALRTKHGEIEVIELRAGEKDTPIVVVSALPAAKFIELQDLEAQRNFGRRFRDPAVITRPLLNAVVHGEDDARAELADSPGFEMDLLDAVSRLAGALRPEVTLEEAEVSEATKAASPGAVAFKLAGELLEFRRADAFDFSNARSDLGAARDGLPLEYLSPVALHAIAQRQALDRAKFDATIERWPAAAKELGRMLYHLAHSRAQRRQGK